ncbi:SfnB family sulfur acquisition oxidoreductase [Paracoccus litorisediminis]|uniref:SfnB family sulfur acquisition oxidoreductase n=1 Tax=Paracoccus litorisediminis TaxID=2006130 RepID=A0A844HNX8_9RHOB|nr:SfnB family sulfur acquisition oxidoreductase [Paracoccus litorisediminis]MTH60819.1 SfnB family sulfur acquisition oxidoreductase [Paracoccus litorisediminis]
MTIHDPLNHPATGRPVAPARIDTREAALDAAHRLAADWAPKAAERDRDRILPHEEIADFSASGLGAITVPRAYGGPGLDYLTLAEVFEILCAADSSVGQIPQNHFGVVQLLSEAGSPNQKARWFADILSGARIGNAGPEKGPKVITHNTTGLTRGPDGLRLNGRRFYSTGAIFAHWIPTRANDEQGRPVQVWVPHDAPGVTVIDDWSSFGQRTTASGTVVFDNVAVPEDQIIPVWQRAQVPGLAGPVSQLVQAAIDSGIAIGALDQAIAFVRDKARPWVDSGVSRAQDDPYIIADIGRLQIDLWAARAVLHDAARLLNDIAAGEVTLESSARASVAVAEAKILTSEIALNAAEKLFELAGSAATRAAPNLGRVWRNARVHTLHDPLRWKYHLLGNWHLNGALPARHQWN